MDLAELTGIVCDELPEDWTHSIVMQRGMLDVVLVDENKIEIPVRDYLSQEAGKCLTERMVIRRVNYARMSDGLNPIETPEGIEYRPDGPSLIPAIRKQKGPAS